MDIEYTQEVLNPEIFTAQPILSGLFILEGFPTTLCFYSHLLTYQNYSTQGAIHYSLDLNYEVFQFQDSSSISGIRLYVNQKEILEFQKENWPSQSKDQWDQQLINLINRKKFHQYFDALKKIGVGNFATVYLAERKKDKLLVAIKVFTKIEAYKGNGKEAIYNEATVLRSLNSPNIIKLMAIYETERSLYMIQEYAEGRHLARFIEREGTVRTQDRKNIMKGILKALAELDRLNIIHRDIKPENIIYNGTENSLKIVDFGLATKTPLPRYLFVRCGTPGYVAPEIINIQNGENVHFDPVSDVFSAGAIFYQLIYSKVLFDGNDNLQILTKNQQCNISDILSSEQRKCITRQELDLLVKLLKKNPAKRIRAADALNHSYFKDTFPITLSNKGGNSQKISNSSFSNSITLSKCASIGVRKSKKA